jgi:hypothetical protein
MLLYCEDHAQAIECYSESWTGHVSNGFYFGCALVGNKEFDKVREQIEVLCAMNEETKHYTESNANDLDLRTVEFFLEDDTRYIFELRCRLAGSIGDLAAARIYAVQALDLFDRLFQTLRAENMEQMRNIDLYTHYARELLHFLKTCEKFEKCWTEPVPLKIVITMQAYINILDRRHEGIPHTNQTKALSVLADLRVAVRNAATTDD